MTETSRPQTLDGQTFLLALSDRLRAFADPLKLMHAAMEAVGRQFEVDRVGYCDVDLANDTLYCPVGWTDGVLEPLVGSLSMSGLFGETYIATFKQGRTASVADIELDPMVVHAAFAAIGTRAFLAVPLVRDGVLVAGLFLNHASVRAWTPDDAALLEQVLLRTWEAIERARAERILRENAARLRLAVEAGQIGEWELDVGADSSVRSPRHDQIFGHDEPVAEWGFETFISHVLPEDRPAVELAFRQAAQTGEGWNITCRIHRRNDDEIRWINVRSTPQTDAAGGAVKLFGMVQDITEQKRAETSLRELNETLQERIAEAVEERGRAEEQLRQSQKMEAVGQLTGGLAHDFNNLLAGISGSLELMGTRLSQGRTSDVERYMIAAQGAARRAASLTHRLLAFSRRQTLAPKPTDFDRLIVGMEDLIRRTVGPSIQLEVVGSGSLWSALVDPPQLENALLNLCINARDAMPDGGRITIETANRWVDRPTAKQQDIPEGQYVSLCVSDSGTGMPPDVIAHVFEPFFTTKPLGEGTGLGLSMIYGFARQSGGQVRIYSEVGAGTTVRLYFPRHHGESDAEDIKQGQEEAPRAEQGETVLVVDDEPTVRMLVIDVLEDLGYIAIDAADSATGLKVLQSKARIDLLVTDVGLPGGMNGRQMADAGRERRPGLKVLFVTGYAESSVLGNGHLAPGMQVLTKPFAVDTLAARIKELIDS